MSLQGGGRKAEEQQEERVDGDTTPRPSVKRQMAWEFVTKYK